MVALTKPDIIIVDDDDGVRDGLTALLESEGQKVESYGNGKDFLESYDPDCCGCLLLDLNMPNMNGHQVLESLAAKGNAIPVIVITSEDDARVEMRALKAGALSVLNKPLEHRKLLDTIRRAMK